MKASTAGPATGQKATEPVLDVARVGTTEVFSQSENVCGCGISFEMEDTC